MPIWAIDLTKFVVGGVLGSLLTFQRMKWKIKQDRKTAWAKKREPIYAKGLEFVYDVEKNQTNAEELDRILKRWAKWFPLNAIYLPPAANNALYGAMYWTVPVTIELMNSKDIGWLPDDLR